MTILSLAPLRRPKPAPVCDAGDAAATHALAASAATVSAVLSPDDPRSCGWFDSSWELQHGLAVNEWAEAELPAAALWFADLVPASALPAESAWLQ
jgi:hypothetical protein